MNTKTTPKDFFLHLGAAIALYAAAVAVINLAFSVIDYAFPDQLAGYFYAGSIIWPVSMLIILTPLLYILEWVIIRGIRNMPERADVWIRRWRIYLTLFLAGALIIGDLIALLNTYLNGEITARFGWKVLAIFLIAAVAFAYYILAKAAASGSVVLWRRITAWLGIILVIAIVVCGFVIVGSPATQRAFRFDQRRVSDLMNIQWDVTNYWQRTGKLPAALSDLNDQLSGMNIPNDPESGAPYEYKIVNQTAPSSSSKPGFELCATFSLASGDTKGRGPSGGGGNISYSPTIAYMPGQNDSWDHGAGRSCFDRTIDPSRYPPAIPQK